jgi:hypothetical protein
MRRDFGRRDRPLLKYHKILTIAPVRLCSCQFYFMLCHAGALTQEQAIGRTKLKVGTTLTRGDRRTHNQKLRRTARLNLWDFPGTPLAIDIAINHPHMAKQPP